MNTAKAIHETADALLDALISPINGVPSIQVNHGTNAHRPIAAVLAATMEEITKCHFAENQRLRHKCNALIQAGRIALMPAAMHATEEPIN